MQIRPTNSSLGLRAYFLVFIFFASTHHVRVLFAEADCSGSTYAESTCSGACDQSDCQDISFGQDGTLFQCCPPVDSVPELPTDLRWALLVGIPILVAWRIRARKKRGLIGG